MLEGSARSAPPSSGKSQHRTASGPGDAGLQKVSLPITDPAHDLHDDLAGLRISKIENLQADAVAAEKAARDRLAAADRALAKATTPTARRAAEAARLEAEVSLYVYLHKFFICPFYTRFPLVFCSPLSIHSCCAMTC